MIRLFAVSIGRSANQFDEKDDGPVAVIDIREVVLARGRNPTLCVFPWVFAVIPAMVAIVAGRREKFNLARKPPDLADLPSADFISIIPHGVELARDDGQHPLDNCMSLSYLLMAILSHKIRLASLLGSHLQKMQPVTFLTFG